MTDTMEQDTEQDLGSSMIALLPTTSGWCQQDLPHMTLAYAGKVADLSPTMFNEMGKTVSMLALIAQPIIVPVTGVSVFGDTEKVNVLTLFASPKLMAIRNFVAPYDMGTYPDFKPHATIGPAGPAPVDTPDALMFDKIIVTWGDENLTFNL